MNLTSRAGMPIVAKKKHFCPPRTGGVATGVGGSSGNLGMTSTEGTAAFRVLINYLSLNVYQYIEDCTNYNSTMATLQDIYVRPRACRGIPG